jgi:hypothetical protein
LNVVWLTVSVTVAAPLAGGNTTAAVMPPDEAGGSDVVPVVLVDADCVAAGPSGV